MNKPVLVVGIALLITGAVFSFLPHDLHNSLLGAATLETESHDHAHDEHGSHDTHQLAGIALTLIGLALAFGGMKK